MYLGMQQELERLFNLRFNKSIPVSMHGEKPNVFVIQFVEYDEHKSTFVRKFEIEELIEHNIPNIVKNGELEIWYYTYVDKKLDWKIKRN